MGTASLSSKTTEVGHTWPVTSLSMSFRPGLYQEPGTNSLLGSQPPIQLGSSWLSPNRHARSVPEGTPCPVLVVLHAGSTAEQDCFPLVVSIDPSGTMKSSKQGGSFQFSSSWTSLCAVVKVHGTLGNRGLLPSSGGQPRALARVNAVLEASAVSLINH